MLRLRDSRDRGGQEPRAGHVGRDARDTHSSCRAGLSWALEQGPAHKQVLSNYELQLLLLLSLSLLSRQVILGLR